jgi:hypothetical protein
MGGSGGLTQSGCLWNLLDAKDLNRAKAFIAHPTCQPPCKESLAAQAMNSLRWSCAVV